MGNKKPKLLYVLQFYHNRGGVEEHVRDLTHGLAEHFEIRCIAPEKDQLVVIKNTETIKTYPIELTPWPVTPYKLPQLEAALDEVLRDFEPDLIHIQHFFNWHVGVIDQITNYKIPVIVTFHDYNVLTPYYTMQGAASPEVALSKEYCTQIFKADISEYVNRRFATLAQSLTSCDYLICPSFYLAEQLGKVLPLKFNIIEHGIPPIVPVSLKPGAEKRFGYIGSKLPQKGWMELLKAFQILKTQHAEAELYFFGGGEKPPNINSPGVKFFPSYTREEIPEICSHFEIGVIPSMFAETFSYVLSEQWACKKPVAASRIGSLGQRVTNGLNGKLFEPGNIASMVETLAWFLESEDWKNWTLPSPKLLDSMIEEYKLLYQSFLRPL